MADNYTFLSKIADTSTRKAMKAALDRLGVLERQAATIGSVSQALKTPLDGGKQYLQNIRDPAQLQDAVTLNYLQTYVANAFQAFSAEQAQAGGSGGQTPPSDDINDGIPDHSAEVTAIWNSAPLGPASTEVEKYRFCRAVAQALETSDFATLGRTCGLLEKDTGANIYLCTGTSYSISRVCYDNGHVFKILVDADPGGANTPTWADNGGVDVSLYKPVAGSGAC
jgi:hypothetical protein